MSSSWRQLGGRATADSQRLGPAAIGGNRDVAVRAVPGRDAVAPPQLAADVPVVDVRQPVLPDLLEALRQDPGRARPRVAASAASASGLTCDEPLGLEPWLHDVVGALAAPDDHLVARFVDLEVAAGVRASSTICRRAS